MARIILLVAVLSIALLLWHKIKTATGEQRKKLIIKTVIGVILASLALLAATGKLNVLTAIIGGLIAMIPRVIGYLRYLPIISRLYSQTKQQNTQQNNRQTQTAKGAMSEEEALAILGLKPGATKEQVLNAHKRMMMKVHPDKGGSDHLAAQINKAKDTLIG